MCVCVPVDFVRPKRSLRSRCYGDSESIIPNSEPSKSVCSMLSKPNHANCISIRVHLARHRLPIFRFENQFTSDHQLPTEQFTPFSFRSKPKSLCCELGVDCISFCAVVLLLFFFCCSCSKWYHIIFMPCSTNQMGNS